MNKTWVFYAMVMTAIALGFSALAPVVIADSNSDKQNSQIKNNVQEFSSSTVLHSSSTTTLCHVPKGNAGNSHEIVVSTSSLTAHLKHGDNIGFCEA
jgi:hypothetical protein